MSMRLYRIKMEKLFNRTLSLMQLRAVKRMNFKFDPFHPNVNSIRWGELIRIATHPVMCANAPVQNRLNGTPVPVRGGRSVIHVCRIVVPVFTFFRFRGTTGPLVQERLTSVSLISYGITKIPLQGSYVSLTRQQSEIDEPVLHYENWSRLWPFSADDRRSSKWVLITLTQSRMQSGLGIPEL